MFLEYILKHHFQDCLDIISGQEILNYYSIQIDFLKVFEINPEVGDNVLCNPIVTLSSCDRDIIKAQQKILEEDQLKGNASKLQMPTLKKNVHVRFYGLPVCPELHRTIFPKNSDLGCFLKVTGTVVRVTQAKMLEYHRKYVCIKCKYENLVEAEFEQRYVLKQPSKCGNQETRCKCSTFTQVNLVSREHCKDYQEIKIQEQINKLNVGTIPGSMWVILEDDLVDCCKPGDDVNICGTVRRRWRPTTLNRKCEVELVLQSNFVEVCNAQRSEVIATAPDIKECFDEYWMQFQGCPIKGRDQILSSVCPQVYGLHLVKLALLLTVITGSNHAVQRDTGEAVSSDDQHKTNVRGQCHLLLVGDPGTGKSQLLRAGADLTPRSVFTSGAGSTRAGLTCCALREDGEWQLEAGALVLSDGGVCCIDEIGQLREHDRTSIHEAMEQQTISIAKAGIVCKLNTRCAIIAACNPKGHYEIDQPLSVNVSLGTPLLSRFDLIFILLDSKNDAWDKLVSSYILFGTNAATSDNKKRLWNLEKLQMYIALVAPRATEVSKSANTILQTYYMMQRKSAIRDPCRTTVRMLDSLVRLSQAHCRLMYRNKVLPIDAINAIALVDLSMQDCTLKDTEDALHSNFYKYPDLQYLLLAKRFLSLMNLYDIWNDELLFYSKLLNVDHKTLSSEVDKESCKLFTKFDNVADENIPLSCSIVTSSYFHRKVKSENQDDNEVKVNPFEVEIKHENRDQVINEKLAATLRKHASLNKQAQLPLIKPKKSRKVKLTPKKRKRKDDTIANGLTVTDNENKDNIAPVSLKKKRKRNSGKQASSSKTLDPTSLLNAVPSVNDVFHDLSINLSYECADKSNVFTSPHKDSSQNSEEGICKALVEMPNNCKTVRKQDEDMSSSSKRFQLFSKNNDSPKLLNRSNNRTDRLKKFELIERRDLSEHYDTAQNVKKPANNDLKLENTDKAISNSSVNSVPNSQISIFESSDCDIDLEI